MGSGRLNSFLSLLVLFVPWTRAQQSVNKTVDDTYVIDLYRPDGIQYGPAWYVEPDGRNRFNNSLHTSTTPGSNLIYFFQGDAIHYYADRDAPHGPAMVYLDGDQSGETVLSNATTLQYQQLLWSKTNLGPGDHQLIIAHTGTSQQYIGLDYLVIESDHGFTPSLAGPAASSIPSEAITVDDNDLSRVSYSSGWDPAVQVSNSFAFHYGNTMHRTDQPGAFVSFKFTGTAVWYYTDKRSGHGKVNITLDGKDSWVVSGDSTFAYAQRALWNVTDLTYGEHTVVVTHQDTEGLWATLDFFRYLPTQPDSVPQDEKTNPPIGPIVGGVVGGVAVVGLCGLAYILIRRRRASVDRPYLEPKDSYGPPMLNPSPGSPPEPMASQPVRGYVPEPYHPPAQESTADSSSAHRQVKGQYVQNSDMSTGTFVSSPSGVYVSSVPAGSVTGTSQTGIGGEGSMRDIDNPPPYV